MKQIILIHAHKNADQLNRLIVELDDPDFSVYVNLDQKSGIDPTGISNRATLIRNRVSIHWGDFTQVQALLNSLRQIVQDEKEFSYVVFISAEDFPVKSNKEIKEFLEANPQAEYLSYRKVGKSHWDCAARYEYYNYKGKNILKRIAVSLLSRVQKLTGLKRKMVMNLEPYAGASWFMLSQKSLQYIFEFVDKHPSYLNYMKYVACSDELFLQTILLNSPFRNNIVNDIFRYIDWSDCEKGLSSSPNILTMKDYEKIIQSNALFCRKVDFSSGKELVEALVRRRQTK